MFFPKTLEKMIADIFNIFSCVLIICVYQQRQPDRITHRRRNSFAITVGILTVSVLSESFFYCRSYFYSYDSKRFPKHILQADSLCTATDSCGYAKTCEPVFQHMDVLQRTNICLRSGYFKYVKIQIQVPRAFACAADPE